MTDPESMNRRQVLQTIPATLIGGSIATGAAEVAHATGPRDRGRANDVEIIAKHDHESGDHQFELNTTEFTAGWTTITLDNQTDHTHLAYVYGLPQAAIQAADEAGTDLHDFIYEHLTRPFQYFLDTLVPDKEPNPDDLSDKYSKPDEDKLFPEWSVRPSGGVGLTAGHTTSRTTLELAPGEYIVECYVKNEKNEFHSYRGMEEHFTVTEGQTGTEPDATLDVSVSTDGIDAPANVTPGQQTVAINFENQKIYEHFVGHDVHLIRFDHRTTVADVNGWMNWMDPAQFISDGTEPGAFMGGAEAIVTPELMEGQTTVTEYVHVNLTPGAYAWVAEVPSPADKNMLKPFIIPFEQN